jgi:hypothetical protein
MRVGGQQPDGFLVPGFHLPGHSPGQEEALGAGQPVEDGCLLTAQRQLIGLPGDAQAAQVADVLPDRQRSVHVLVRHLLRRETVVLLDQ